MGRWRRNELEDVDDVAVERTINGDPPRLSMGERYVATIELRHRGYSYKAIGRHLDMDIAQVYRYLRRAGLTRSREKEAAA